jgi:hypothetical protein
MVPSNMTKPKASVKKLRIMTTTSIAIVVAVVIVVAATV